MDFISGHQLIDLCREEGIDAAEAMIRREISQTGTAREEIADRMRTALHIMKSAASQPLRVPLRSVGGMIGGEAARMKKRMEEGEPLCGRLLGLAQVYAVAVLEVNASMGVIVAAPTAGASGVLPGVLLAMQEVYGLSDDEVLRGLYTAGAVGYLLMRNASVSGAEAGCQAEVGSASAMAAAAAAVLRGASPEEALQAASFALANLLGLVCDPIAGLVERPCQSRNAMGAAAALTAADMVLAGCAPAVPFDEMAEAMLKVGKALPSSLRETARGGCAATPTGKHLKECIFGCNGTCKMV